MARNIETFLWNGRIHFMRFATILAFAGLVGAADFKDVNRSVALRADGSVEIDTHKGSIHVTVWDKPQVEIQARIEEEPGTIMDRRSFDGTDVRINGSTDSVRIKTEYPMIGTGNLPEVRYALRIPKTARLTIRDHRSTTEITGLQGALVLSTYRGTAKVDFAAFTGSSSVSTYRGDVKLSMPKTSRFDLQTSPGRRGSVYTDFTVMAKSSGKRGEGVHGTVNGGGPTLRIETYRGEIQVHGR